MAEKDIRWKQRFHNYKRALAQFTKAIEIFGDIRHVRVDIEQLELMKEGLIQRFEFTYELAWNVLKDWIEQEMPGNFQLLGSKTTLRAAFKVGLIEDEKTWLDMVASRQASSHTYEQKIADDVFEKAMIDYLPVFLKLQAKMESLY